MATTTPNYGWDVPTSTDYVKDGATAIETLGDDIDATLYSVTGGKGVGLQLLTNTSFSAVSTANFSNVFSSTYTVYKVIMQIAGSSYVPLKMRFRENTTDKAASYYGASGIAAYGGQFQLGNAQNNSGQIDLRDITNTNQGIISLDVNRPDATYGSITGTLMDIGNYQAAFIAASNIFMSNFTGFTIYTTSGTMTGNVKIYGYKESI
jgi:hypothetical protein